MFSKEVLFYRMPSEDHWNKLSVYAKLCTCFHRRVSSQGSNPKGERV